MTKKSRTILFIFCILLFLIIAPLTVYYSQGYRFDFTGRKVTRTGGIFLQVLPKQADIYLNGTFEKKTDFLFGSALVDNLLPKKYKIEVKKEGYLAWEKTLEIKEKEVVESKSIILFPQNLNFLKSLFLLVFYSFLQGLIPFIKHILLDINPMLF